MTTSLFAELYMRPTDCLSILCLSVALAGAAPATPPRPLAPAEHLQNEVHDELTHVRERLLSEEADNFAELWIEHQPEWRVVFAFKRDAEATLRRYSSNPRFVARQVRYSMAELEAARDDAARQLDALGVPMEMTDADEVGNDVDIRTRLEQPEVERLLASGRLHLHPAVNVTGPPAFTNPAVTPDAARLVRIFPQMPHRNSIGTRELGYGTIILRDGCLRFDGPGDDDPLIRFTAETGLRLDEAGRLTFYDRVTSEPRARVGEPLALSAGAGRGEITDPEVTGPIQAACGPGRVTYGGWFESLEGFEQRTSRR